MTGAAYAGQVSGRIYMGNVVYEVTYIDLCLDVDLLRTDGFKIELNCERVWN